MSDFNLQFEKQLIQDLSLYKTFNDDECYINKNKSEINIIRKNFFVVHDFSDTIYFSISNNNIRKIKLLVIINNKLGKKLLKILKNSKLSSYEDALTSQLSYELSKEIDKEILKNLFKIK